MKLLKQKSYAKLKKELDKVFSEWIRNKDLDKNGLATCITCGKKGLPSELQAGHYISRTFTGTRWDEKNVHVQCVSCNLFLKGNIAQYAFFLTQKYGGKILEELQFKKEHPPKLSATDLELLINDYKNKLKSL